MQQAYAVEGGGFRGRTNKLVDGCYGWWVGGLFAVLESVMPDQAQDVEDESEHETEEPIAEAQDGQTDKARENFVLTDKGEWEEVHPGKDMLYNRTALQEYILIAAQSEKGGLRDKPGK